MATTLIFLGLLILLAHAFESLFARIRIPDVLLLIIIGILIGPVFGLMGPNDLGEVARVFSSLTLIFVLFDGGIGLSIESLKKYWRGVVQVTLLSFLVCILVCWGICVLMGFEMREGMLLGAILAGTGASVVIPFIRQMRVSEYTRIVLTMESALSAVLSIVVAMSLMDAYKLGSMMVGAMVGNILSAIIMASLIGMGFALVWGHLLIWLRRTKASMFLTPAFVFIVYGITEALGFSGPIAVLMFGIVMGNNEFFNFGFMKKWSHRDLEPLEETEKTFFKELVFIFKTYFFVYIGISIPFTNWVALLYGAIITVALFVVRYLLLLVVGRNNGRNDRRIVSMMIPKGLSTALLASMPEQINQMAGHIVIPHAIMIKYVTYAVVFFSIVGTSLLVFLTRKSLMKTEDELSNEVKPEDVAMASFLGNDKEMTFLRKEADEKE